MTWCVRGRLLSHIGSGRGWVLLYAQDHPKIILWIKKIIFWVLFGQLSEEGPCEELSGDGQPSSFNEWILPAKEFDGMWERYFYCLFFFTILSHWCTDTVFCSCSLIYESGLKQRLLRYASSALLFTEKGVDPFLVTWNR